MRSEITGAHCRPTDVLSFGLASLDDRLAGGGLARGGLHEFAAASAELWDDAAATLFLAGVASRFGGRDRQVLWAVTAFDLYAPGVEQAGLSPTKVFFAQGRRNVDILAIAEDALRDGALGCVVAEVSSADMTATRRLQLAAADSETPLLLFRRHRSRGRCPLETPSAAMTRWRIGSTASAPLPWSGVGRPRWRVELVRQRNGAPFSLELEACDAEGRLALPAAAADRATAAERAVRRAA
ncbi:ImuA family protein [Allosphingosinicella indica]|uniref:ImuA family protein n=1 Tax=Allosphingosinicella indica TaxID=941907 RepID=UPI001FCCCCF1|nr:protein ImuA [Allosphingosinicella indica]